MRKYNSILLLGSLVAILLMFGCSSGGNRNANKPNPSAIEKMSVVFEGNHSIENIKEKMDAVMGAYKVEINETNYEKCGSALVSLRKASGVTEMDIIENMLEANTSVHGISFSDQAALSALLLKNE